MGKTPSWYGWLVLIVGVLYLIADFSTWNFFGITGWTAFFVLFGLWLLSSK